MRQLKRTVKIGNITIGGTNPIAVQTMLNVPVKDIAGNVEQAKRVAKAGCQIVRVTVPTPADAAVVSAIKEAVDIPVVADIHFDYRAALAAIDAGADKIRINPGNIGDDDRVKAVADACNAKKHPHPHWRERRQPGKAYPGPLRCPCAGSHGGKCHVPCAPAGKA